MANEEIEEKVVLKKNNLNTRFIPALLMLLAGTIACIVCVIFKYETTKFLLVVFLSMLIFAIIGAVIKGIIDNFDMHISYSDILDDEGEVVEK